MRKFVVLVVLAVATMAAMLANAAEVTTSVASRYVYLDFGSMAYDGPVFQSSICGTPAGIDVAFGFSRELGEDNSGNGNGSGTGNDFWYNISKTTPVGEKGKAELTLGTNYFGFEPVYRIPKGDFAGVYLALAREYGEEHTLEIKSKVFAFWQIGEGSSDVLTSLDLSAEHPISPRWTLREFAGSSVNRDWEAVFRGGVGLDYGIERKNHPIEAITWGVDVHAAGKRADDTHWAVVVTNTLEF